ncbi:MAG: helix-turn-helix domain-containing protein [Treponema sp.]|nr:helix-turn-helix domain-containing protein [Treponema sp.]
MEKYQQVFINNMRYYRKLRSLSQAELTEKCEVATGTVGNIECGLAKPSFDLILTMAQVLGIVPSKLFAENQNLSGSDINIIKEHEILKEFYEKLKDNFE